MDLSTITDQERTRLKPDLRSDEVNQFSETIKNLVVGQERPIRYLTKTYESFRTGLRDTQRPLGVFLFMGPTGVGKTHVVRAVAEALHNNPNAITKIDCAEFQQEHEICRLIGAPPGYLGHGHGTFFNQEHLDRWCTKENPISILLFDEIEKADYALCDLLLGVLDTGVLGLGDGTEMVFSNTIIVFTSNLGARQMSENISKSIGFVSPKNELASNKRELENKNYEIAKLAAKKHFSPEFINRLDRIAVFQSLSHEDLRQVLQLEISHFQARVAGFEKNAFTLSCSKEALEFILREGTDLQFGARKLKRAIAEHLIDPLNSMVDTRQIRDSDRIIVDFCPVLRSLVFDRDAQTMLVGSKQSAA